MIYLFWALIGWCGTPWPWWHWWKWPPPPPPPDGDPWWWGVKVISVVAGIVGGVLFDRAFTSNQLPTGSLGHFIVTGAGAYILGRVASDIVSSARAAAKSNVR